MFMLVTVKYNLEATSMIVLYYLIDDMTVDTSMELKFTFSQVNIKYSFNF
jgi:hypothetical protein